ncbi:hypothetical protein BV25DRAFT_1037195 [Artomyces pyxidatus]|uniref:Uncharacterized protein n=1 Tax=Artomyces pyxidatus TaxID=48021 RepID=A0ACB8SUJ5_9AGAM|nr:hypothetical protein BV25DRAFT_1037195 [Artomyces pyxidatus]
MRPTPPEVPALHSNTKLRQKVPALAGLPSMGTEGVLGNCVDHDTVTPAKPSDTLRLEKLDLTSKMSSAIQSAQYGAEMLRCIPDMTHAIGSVVCDEFMWLWWFDRQGAMQSTSINFILDLPRFLVLLLAFQRFTLEDWGFPSRHSLAYSIQNNENQDRSGGIIVYQSTLPPKPFHEYNAVTETQLHRDDDDHGVNAIDEPHLYVSEHIHDQSTSSGRGVTSDGATNHSTHPHSGGDFDGKGSVMKVYSPDVTRASEATVIECADETAKLILRTKDSLSNVLYTRDRLQPSGLPDVDCIPARVSRAIVFERLEVITKLHGKEFFKAWVDSVVCNRVLWKCGVQHGDPTVDNLMFRRLPDGTIAGTLAYWDLASIDGHAARRNLERAGTIPFIALELLCWPDDVERRYEHDLESMVWILPWVLLIYENGLAQANHALAGWLTGDYGTCAREKTYFLSRLGYAVQTVSWTNNEWAVALSLLIKVRTRNERRQDSRWWQRIGGQAGAMPALSGDELYLWIVENMTKDVFPSIHTLAARARDIQVIV